MTRNTFFFFLAQCVQLEYVRVKTSIVAWDCLPVTFWEMGVRNNRFLRKILLTLKLTDSDSQEHFVTFDSLVRQLKSSGEKLLAGVEAVFLS